MPFIRYRTGDLAVFGGVIDGTVRLRSIEGRDQDYLLGPTGRQFPVTAIVFGGHLKAFKNIKKWQILQKTPGEIEIRVQATPAFSDDDVSEIERRFRETANIKASLTFVDQFELTSRGKFRFVLNRCGHPLS